MVKKSFGYLLVGCLFLCSCTRQETPLSVMTPQTDSVSREVTVYLLKSDLTRAMEVVDSADAAGLLSEFDAEMFRLRIISRDEGQLAEAVSRYEALLESGVPLIRQLDVLNALVYLSRQRDNHQKVLDYGTRYIEVCRQTGKTVLALTVQGEMGRALILLGRTEEGLEMIDQTISQADAVRQFTEMDACILAMKSKMRTLIDLKRYEEVIPVGEHMIAKLQDLAAHPDEYADGTSRMPKPDRLPGYVDFYTGQAYAFLTFAYAALDRLDEARAYDRLHARTNYSRSYGGRKQMASAWCMMGDYDRMNAVYDEMVAAMGADTVNHDYSLMLFNRAKVAGIQGKPALSANYWKRYASLLRELYDKERLAAAEESAARFHEQEQQYALENEQARHKRDLIIQISLSVTAVLISIVAFLIFYQWRITRRKNALLSKEIAQNTDYKMRYFRMSHPEQTAEVKDDKSVPQLSTMSNAELFEFLHVVITGEQLYLNPLFDRQYLMDRFGLSKEHVGAAFSQGSPYASLADYVNECRLSYSTLLLSNRPDMSIADVASASGFSNASVFARNFKQRFTMTPTEFRNKEN